MSKVYIWGSFATLPCPLRCWKFLLLFTFEQKVMTCFCPYICRVVSLCVLSYLWQKTWDKWGQNIYHAASGNAWPISINFSDFKVQAAVFEYLNVTLKNFYFFTCRRFQRILCRSIVAKYLTAFLKRQPPLVSVTVTLLYQVLFFNQLTRSDTLGRVFRVT